MGSGAASRGGTVAGIPITPADMDALRCACPIPSALPDHQALNRSRPVPVVRTRFKGCHGTLWMLD